MIYVCPYCQESIKNISEKCSACGMFFDSSQWPEEAFSTKGMLPRLKITWPDNSWEPNSSEFIIGREPGPNGLALPGQFVSRNHAKVFCSEGEWHIERVNKPISVNSEEVSETILRSGDFVQIGPFLLKISIAYIQNVIYPSKKGNLYSASTEKLDTEKIYIGSDPAKCRIVIDGADPIHALIYHHITDDAWWIADCASGSGVKVNNKRIRNKRLYPSDGISIAGLDFLYNGNELSLGTSTRTGLSLNFNNTSAETPKGFQILKELNFNVSPGEFVGILGPSGSGKSSLIQRIVGLASFTSGEMSINGEYYHDLPNAYRDAMSYLPQQNSLHEDLTLAEEFSCFCSIHEKQDNHISYDTINQVLRLVGLESEVNKKISKLSGGQKRRAGIALALLRNPQLLVLDEPTSGLDPATETEVMTYLRRISNQKKTVICATHIMGNIDLFDKVLVLSRGYLVFWGTPGELLDYFKIDQPLSLYKTFATGYFEEQVQTAEEIAARYNNSSIAQKYHISKFPCEPLPSERPISICKQVSGYWKRMFYELISFKNNGPIWKTFWDSPCFIQLLFQPFLVALVLKVACAYNLLSDDGRKEVLFFSASAVFWLGLNNAVRELVKERIPWRCLERLQRISTTVYLFSKVSWTTFLSAIQVLMFSLFLFEIPCEETSLKILPNFSVVSPPTENPSSLHFIGGIFLVLFLVCTMGAWIGLAVSAFFKKENSAVGLLPIIMIPVLFFSQPIIRNDNYDDISKPGKGNYAKIAIALENVMPCHAAEILMDLQNSENLRRKAKISDVHGTEEKKTIKAWWPMMRNTTLYLVLALAVMIFFQRNNETKWDGR